MGSGIEFRLTLLVAGDGVAKVEQETLAWVDMGRGKAGTRRPASLEQLKRESQPLGV